MKTKSILTIGLFASVFYLIPYRIFSQALNPLIQQGIQPPKSTKPVKSARPVMTPAGNDEPQKFGAEHTGDFVYFKFNSIAPVKGTDFFSLCKKELKMRDADEFRLLQKDHDDIGFIHYRYDHYYKGLPVMGSQIVLHEKSGNLSSANGKFISNLNLEAVPAITATDAIRKAMVVFDASKYSWEEMGVEHSPADADLSMKEILPEPRLIFAFREGNTDRESYRLCYEVALTAAEPAEAYHFYVDVINGEVINRIALYQNADVSGTANTLYSGTKAITMDSYAGSYRLRESGRPVQTLDLNHKTTYHASYLTDFTNPTTSWVTPDIYIDSAIITSLNIAWIDNGLENPLLGNNPDLFLELRDPSNNLIVDAGYDFESPLPDTIQFDRTLLRWNSSRVSIWDYDNYPNVHDSLGTFVFFTQATDEPFSANGTAGTLYRTSMNNPALDAHWGIEKTYDFYNNVLNRNSYNDSGAIIKTCLHFGFGIANAYWSAENKAILIGDGQTTTNGLGVISNPWCSLDLIGHEFTHGVVSSTCKLIYQGQSGSLNESFADIFGTSVEQYAGNSPNWLLSEGVIQKPPYYLRSMSNPNSGLYPQPDTYRGLNWYPPNQSWDQGGVHINSGVQNFWFYLLSNGGSGTNDNGQGYNVTSIGITDAQKIAYRNMAYYLTPGSDFYDAYQNSLLAADDLFGGGASQVDAVRAAWWAVGIGNDPNAYCHGNTWFAWPFYSFSDGSGRADYNHNSNCTWLLAPTGADSLTLVFTSFNTESIFDSVIVYDGPDETYPVVTIWWGNTLPPPITSSNGALFVKFVTDNSQRAAGWSAYYVGYGLPACLGITALTDSAGSFEDGSGPAVYKNNSLCGWLIAPPCATGITLNFNSFNTEFNYDKVFVYDGNSLASPLLFTGSGGTIPLPVNSTQGEMLVVFLSDYSVKYPGFSASYTSSGSPVCSGMSIRTADNGVVEDGSARNNYCNNLNCQWLIQPVDAVSITLNFTLFDLEPVGENQSFGDALEIYDGADTNAALIGRYAGNNLPPAITSTGNSLFLKFYTNYSDTYDGWRAVYTTNTVVYCQDTTLLTAPSGNFSDGSGNNLYGNNSDCYWLIQPTNALSVSLGFSSFSTEQNYDLVEVYDGVNASAPLLGSFSGIALPSLINSNGGDMFVHFYTSTSDRMNGWDAYYTSTISSIPSYNPDGIKVFPNPSTGFFEIQRNETGAVNLVELKDVSGRTIQSIVPDRPDFESMPVDFSDVALGSYLLCLKTKSTILKIPLVIIRK